MHVRGQIRARLEALLESLAVPIVADYPDSVRDSDLPIAYLWVGSEDVSALTLAAAPKQERQTQLFVDLFGLDNRDQIERLEEMTARIETAIAADQTLLGLAQSCQLRALTVDREDAGGQSVMRHRLQFDLVYFTITGRPDAVA